jgi:hypothetical protein
VLSSTSRAVTWGIVDINVVVGGGVKIADDEESGWGIPLGVGGHLPSFQPANPMRWPLLSIHTWQFDVDLPCVFDVSWGTDLEWTMDDHVARCLGGVEGGQLFFVEQLLKFLCILSDLHAFGHVVDDGLENLMVKVSVGMGEVSDRAR